MNVAIFFFTKTKFYARLEMNRSCFDIVNVDLCRVFNTSSTVG